MLEPINKQDRIIAQRKFFGIYLLSLLIPVFATYFWTRSTSDKLKAENEQFKKLIILMGRVDTLGIEMKKLYAIDQEFNNNPSLTDFTSTSKSSIKQSEDLITTMMVRVKLDSAILLSAMEGDNREIASSIINNFNIYYDFWSTLKSRGEVLKNKGIDLSELEKCRQDLQLAQLSEKTSNSQLQMALASKGGGGGGGASCDKYIDENIDLKSKIRELERKVKEAEGRPNTGTSSTVVVTNNADVNLLEVRRMFEDADCDKLRADEGRKRKSRKEIEELYTNSYNKFKTLYEKTTNPDIRTKALIKLDDIKHKLKNPPED